MQIHFRPVSVALSASKQLTHARQSPIKKTKTTMAGKGTYGQKSRPYSLFYFRTNLNITLKGPTVNIGLHNAMLQIENLRKW